MSNLSDRLIKLVSEKAGGKHTVFARKAGIPASTFQGYMNGRLPHADHLIRIRETFDVDLNWLLSGHGEPYAPPAGKPALGQADLDPNPEIAELLEGARKVLTSGNPVAYDALERNIRYFSHAIDVERRLNDMESRLEKIETRAGPKCCPEDHVTERKAG